MIVKIFLTIFSLRYNIYTVKCTNYTVECNEFSHTYAGCVHINHVIPPRSKDKMLPTPEEDPCPFSVYKHHLLPQRLLVWLLSAQICFPCSWTSCHWTCCVMLCSIIFFSAWLLSALCLWDSLILCTVAGSFNNYLLFCFIDFMNKAAIMNTVL